jgi:hypothetical protein
MLGLGIVKMFQNIPPTMNKTPQINPIDAPIETTPRVLFVFMTSDAKNYAHYKVWYEYNQIE